MSKATDPTPGVLPPPGGDTPRYLVLSTRTALPVEEWEQLGRPAWSVRWTCPVELPGGESRAEYLFARTAIPCHRPPTVAGCPPFEAVGAELGYSTPRGEQWVPCDVEQCPTLTAARTIVAYMRVQGGRYVTWDRSLSEWTHQLYCTDGDGTALREQPVYPEQTAAEAGREDGGSDTRPPAGPRRRPIPATDTAYIGPPVAAPKRRPGGRQKGRKK